MKREERSFQVFLIITQNGNTEQIHEMMNKRKKSKWNKNKLNRWCRHLIIIDEMKWKKKNNSANEIWYKTDTKQSEKREMF